LHLEASAIAHLDLTRSQSNPSIVFRGKQEVKKRFRVRALTKLEMGTVLNDGDDLRIIDEIQL
jgi:hypothetical protein